MTLRQPPLSRLSGASMPAQGEHPYCSGPGGPEGVGAAGQTIRSTSALHQPEGESTQGNESSLPRKGVVAVYCNNTNYYIYSIQ